MTDDDIKKMDVKDYEEYEKERMQKNAWSVAEELQKRIDDAPILGDYIKAFLAEDNKEGFFIDPSYLSRYMEVPDPNHPGHHQKPFKTPSRNRYLDDWLPRANIKKAFYNGTEFDLETENGVQTFANKFAVDVKHVKEYYCHLKILNQRAEMRAEQRKKSKKDLEEKKYDYNWMELVLDGKIKKLKVHELDKYLQKYILQAGIKALKNDKVNCITSHVLNLRTDTQIGRTKAAEEENAETDDECDEDGEDSDKSDVLDDLSDDSDDSDNPDDILDEESDLQGTDYIETRSTSFWSVSHNLTKPISLIDSKLK